MGRLRRGAASGCSRVACRETRAGPGALPWIGWITGPFAAWYLICAHGLAFFNVVLPLLILRLVTGRRRFFNLRALMVLPLVAALPLMGYLTLAPWLPVWPGRVLSTEARVFLVGTVTGLPLAAWLTLAAVSLLRGRWSAALVLAGLVSLAALAIAGGWIWRDGKSMAAIEHYGANGWYLVALPGAYAGAALWIVGRGAGRGLPSGERHAGSATADDQ